MSLVRQHGEASIVEFPVTLPKPKPQWNRTGDLGEVAMNLNFDMLASPNFLTGMCVFLPYRVPRSEKTTPLP